MIRYRYAHQLSPPAPFVNVTLRCPSTGARAVALPAQLDIAADRTVLPGRVVESLGLVEDGRALFQGFAGEVIELPVFLVREAEAEAEAVSLNQLVLAKLALRLQAR